MFYSITLGSIEEASKKALEESLAADRARISYKRIK